MTWTSENPHLSGPFAPVFDCLDESDLAVAEGAIPEDLDGAYFRNGSNPLFEPLSYTYPFDGDGMVHAVYLSGGKARYRNRYVETRGLQAERREGRALYGGLMAPALPQPDIIRPEDDPGPIKNGAFIHILAHAGRLLAPYEVSSAYEMTWDLETKGEWLAESETPLTMGAHTRRHPKTGDLFAIAYSINAPEASLHRIDAQGRLQHTRTVGLAAPTMLHDFALTERHLVLFCGPVIFDIVAAMQGGALLQWRPEMGTRIGLIPLDGGPERWLEAPASFSFHLTNAFERGGEVVLDYVRYESFSFGGDPKVKASPPRHHRMRLPANGGAVQETCLSKLPAEFPRSDQGFESLPTRVIFSPTMRKPSRAPAGASFDSLLRIDAETGESQLQSFPGCAVGEAAFVPKPGRTAEGEGYLALFLYNLQQDSSDFLILDAQDLTRPPVARISLPRRVPLGLHGSWVERSAVWL
ncbi:MAG: carotenoid oxygenase family protein [Pseudomonadota bacterium]